MTEAVIRVDGLGKRYSLSHLRDQRYIALRDVLVEKATGLFRRNGKARQRDDRTTGQPDQNPTDSTQSSSSELLTSRTSTEDFWALRNISFEVRQGEVVGIIGRNGAGKSTLLKILSRITEPTEGRVHIKGRVASLLEVGTGFHPELTGRENIFLNGAILGMTRAEINKKFDEIVTFAEVEKFLDTPVKRYSSGMYVRLAFAVAAHLEPEILIVDEVLAVGDAEFQKKCLGKMQSVARGEGRTVLFVSHNMAAVEALCSRTLHIAAGKIVRIGSSAAVIAEYLRNDNHRERLPDAIAVGKGLELVNFELTPNPARSGDRLSFELEFQAMESNRMTELAILVYSSAGARLAILDLRDHGLPLAMSPSRRYLIQGEIGRFSLVEGDYHFGIYIATTNFSGDLLNLLRLTVSPAEATGSAPYPTVHRGFIELDYSASVIAQ
jgi:lipopolysaccharide transport system ATP-binding protein